jgi:outer membrane protein OmpA-like peptidoglycan-associated protein
MSMTPVRPRVLVALFALPVFLPVLLASGPARAQRTVTPAPGLDDEPTPPSVLRPGRDPDEDVSAVGAGPVAPPPGANNSDSYLPSLMGPIGLYHLSTAEVGPTNHLRLGLHFDWFKNKNFLVAGDDDTRVDGTFTFGYTPHRYVELFGALLTSSNRNQRSGAGESPARRDPELIKSFGDLVLGGKTAVPVARGMTVGFELGFRFLSSISDLSVSPSSTSLWLGPLYMLDLRPLNGAPVRFHASANFYVDNSRNLIDFSDPTISIYTREVASFAYGIADSRFRLGAGVDLPFEARTAPVPLTPFAEYHAEIVTSSADPAFKNQPNDTKNRDQQWMTLGLRARVFHGLTVDAGADLRIRSVGYEYGPPLPPYMLIFGASFPLDIDAFTRPTVVTRTVERTVNTGPPPVLEGQVTGTVKSGRDGKPVANAIVAVANKPLSRVATDPDGTFRTIMLPPGPLNLDVTAPGFEPTRVAAAVILGRPAKADVVLTPKVMTGNVRGKVTDSKGHPLQAALRLAGVETYSAQADASGMFSAALPVGPYRVIAEMPGMPSKEVTVDIVEGHDSQLDIVMRAPNPNVTLAGDVVTLKQPLKFKAGPAKLDAKMQGELDGVAELLQDHPELHTLKVEAYWDNSAGPKAKSMTDAQAKAIKDYLIGKGVADARVDASGQGAEKPLVPNIGPVNKAKNRRVELHIVQ